MPPLLAVVVAVLLVAAVGVAIPRHQGEVRQLSQRIHRTSSHRRLGVANQGEESEKGVKMVAVVVVAVIANRERRAATTTTTTTTTITTASTFITTATTTFITASDPNESSNQGENQRPLPITTTPTAAVAATASRCALTPYKDFVVAHQC